MILSSRLTTLRAVEARGRKLLAAGPRAAAIRHEPATGRMAIDLVNRCLFAFPAHPVRDLPGASRHSADDLAWIEVDGLGFNLHWPTLDVDLDVPAMAAGILGTRAKPRSPAVRAAGAPAGSFAPDWVYFQKSGNICLKGRSASLC